MPPLLASALRPIALTTKPRFLPAVTTDPYWSVVPNVDSLHLDRFGTFTPPSCDHTLLQLAASAGLTVASSTSSATPPLMHCCYAVLGREGAVDVQLLGREYAKMPRKFTFTATAPVSVILRRRWVDQHGRVVEKHVSRGAMEAGEVAGGVAADVDGCRSVYAVDRLQGSKERTTILSELGQAMERMFTMEPQQFTDAFVKQQTPHSATPASATASASASPSTFSSFTAPAQQYSYLSTGTTLIRAQLDCHDPLLTTPPSPVFDIKTRATHAIRYNLQNYRDHLHYNITHMNGILNSFEREYYDMGRSAFLKYTLQCRIGGMQGVMVAYHNTQRIYGMQMISVAEMERLILGHHSRVVGERVYNASLHMLDTIYQRVVERVREEAVRTGRRGVGGVEEAVKVTLARNVWDEERTMSVYVEMSGPPAGDFDVDLPFSHRHHTGWRLDVLDLPGLQSIAAAHGLTELAAIKDRLALLHALEDSLGHTNSRHPPSVEHMMHLINTGRLFRYRVKVQHTLDGRLIERWNELTTQQVSSLQTSYELIEQRTDNAVQVRRVASEYRVALIEGRLHVEEEEEGEWDIEEGVEARVEQLEAKAVVSDADAGALEQEVDGVASKLHKSHSQAHAT